MVSLAALKGYDMLIEPFAAAGEVLSFDLTRQQVAFNLFRGRLEMYWPKMKCWLLIVASAGLLEPYVYISYLRQAHDAKKLHLGGLSFNFSAKVSDYMRQVWAKNMLYNFATCGLWSILGFSARFAARWADSKIEILEHTDSSHITGQLATFTRAPVEQVSQTHKVEIRAFNRRGGVRMVPELKERAPMPEIVGVSVDKGNRSQKSAPLPEGKAQAEAIQDNQNPDATTAISGELVVVRPSERATGTAK